MAWMWLVAAMAGGAVVTSVPSTDEGQAETVVMAMVERGALAYVRDEVRVEPEKRVPEEQWLKEHLYWACTSSELTMEEAKALAQKVADDTKLPMEVGATGKEGEVTPPRETVWPSDHPMGGERTGGVEVGGGKPQPTDP